MNITWDTDCNAPCAAGQIVADDGRTLLIQIDWDYPGVANTFGWTPALVQRCKCGHIVESTDDTAQGCPVYFVCDADRDECELDEPQAACFHSGTDGTVDCEICGVTANDFIQSASEWLNAHDGATADDPGYFQ